ncbi:MAG: putative metal-dependent hydrolase [Bacteroidetes bacterium]|nr:putative metal-dependent hydrolase [Bacteroidota bacterium]
MEELKYPVGHYQKPKTFTKEVLTEALSVIEQFPKKIKKEVESLSDEQLDTPYRPDGWTIRQVVHHCADSHMNAFIRIKLALTENTPTIKPYAEALWAELSDTKKLPIQSSLSIIEGVHFRWTTLLKNMNASDFDRGFIHPEKGKELSLHESTGMYAWHCNHHLAHITALKKRKGWQ